MHESMTHLWSVAGWAILHYAWIGVVFTVGAWLGRLLLRRASPRVRYLYAVACFVSLALLPMLVSVTVFRSAEHGHAQAWAARHARRAASSATTIIEPLDAIDAVELHVEASGEVGEVNLTDPANRSAIVLAEHPNDRHPVSATATLFNLIDGLARWAPALWLAGFPIACCWLSAGLLGADHLRRRSQLLAEGPIVTMCNRLAEAVGLRTAPRVGVCERISRPILIGILRPIILLPPAAVTGWSPQQLEVVLLHELAHIRRWDNLISLCQRLGEAMLFFQPGIWVVSAWIRLEREQCCDEAVVRRTQDARFYVETLVFVARLTQPETSITNQLAWRSDAASAMAESHLVARIRRILHKEQDMKRQMFEMRASRRWGFSLLLLCIVLLVVAGSWGPLAGRGGNAALAENDQLDDTFDASPESNGLDSAEEEGGVKQFAAQTDDEGGGLAGASQSRRRFDPPKERLRYDGKTFATWSEEWETELNPNRRGDALQAFEAFARYGYGEEATRTILNVMRRYDTRVIGKSPEGKLKSAAIDTLSKIDPKHCTAMINDALQSQNRNEVHFALHVVSRNNDLATSAWPHLHSLLRGKDSRIITHAIDVAATIQPRPAELPKTLRQLMLSNRADVVRTAAMVLIPQPDYGGEYPGMDGAGMGMGAAGMEMGMGSMGSGMSGLGMGGIGEMRGMESDMEGGFGMGEAMEGGYGSGMMSAMMGEGAMRGAGAGMAGGSGGVGGYPGGGMRAASSPAPDYFPELVEALKSADQPTAATVLAAIERLGPKAKSATPALVELLAQKEPAKSNALHALAALGVLASETLPLIVPLCDDEDRNVRLTATQAIGTILLATKNKSEIASTIPLLEKPYRKHPELRMRILQIWYRSGPHAAVIRNVLKEATDDPNPKVRNAAAALLARLPKS